MAAHRWQFERAGGAPGWLAWLAALGLALSLAGCGNSHGSGGKSAQVVAQVNGEEISIHQLQMAQLAQLAGQRNRSAPPDKPQEAALERLIDRQLALQQAEAEKLSRRPEVMLRLEEARRDVLASAWAEEQAARLSPPSEEQAARYYREHPALFAERRLYRLREVSIAVGAVDAAVLQARLQRGQGLSELLRWLQAERIDHTEQRGWRPAEQLPIEAADLLLAKPRGESLAVALPRQWLLYEIEDYESAPINWRQALPLITDHLRKRQQNELLQAELSRLRAAAQIHRHALPPAAERQTAERQTAASPGRS